MTEGYFLYFGLPGKTEYVTKFEKKTSWFNISYQYTKTELNQLIEIFRNNLELTANEDLLSVIVMKNVNNGEKEKQLIKTLKYDARLTSKLINLTQEKNSKNGTVNELKIDEIFGNSVATI